MDGTGNKPGGEGEYGGYIWLRYATQFTVGGRTHTIEMGVPMPLGASEETRAQLLHEAEAGMDQLADHIEQRVSQAVRRGQASGSAPAPKAPPAPKPVTRPAAMPAIPASTPAPQTSAQPLQPAAMSSRETEVEPSAPSNGEIIVPPTRPNIGASMPSIPGAGSDSSGNISIPDFLRSAKENYGLDSTQAMKLLKVKSLSGINLRAALVRLQSLVGQEHGEEEKPENNESRPASARTDTPSTASSSRSPSSDASPAISPRDMGSRVKQEPEREMVSEERPVYIFDEEVEPDDLDDGIDDLDLPRELTAQELDQARTKVNRLRESRGATAASERRLQVLNNLISEQISQEQLLALIGGVWAVTTTKKLKVDQLEELISWAKEDDFVGEVEAVLLLLEEDR